MLFDEDGTFTGRVGVTATRLNARGAELRNHIQVGATLGIETEFYQPLDFGGRFFVAPGFLILEDNQDVFDDDGDQLAVYEVSRRAGVLDAGVQLGRYGELRLGVLRGTAKADATVGSTDLPEFDVDVGGLRGRLSSTGRQVELPQRGFTARRRTCSSPQGIGADDGMIESISGLGVLAQRPEGLARRRPSGGELGSDLPAYDQFTVGGFLSLSGLERGQLRGPYAGVLRGGLLYRLNAQPSAVAKGVYLGAYAEAGNVWQQSDEIGEDPIFAGTLLLGVDSFLGPNTSLTEWLIPQDGFYFSLGRTFQGSSRD